nr:hypothetical protein [Tanacetum cinerariifolium]
MSVAGLRWQPAGDDGEVRGDNDGVEMVLLWRLWSGDEGEERGGACYSGSGRSVDKKTFWFRPESSSKKFSGVGERRRW